MFIKRIAIFVLYNFEKQILLQHRDENAKYYPNYWGFFGGSIENGETVEEALMREADEELQMHFDKVQLFKRYEIEEDIGKCERFLFLIPTKKSLSELKKQQLEGDDLKFFNSEELAKLKLNPYTKFIFDDIFSFLNK